MEDVEIIMLCGCLNVYCELLIELILLFMVECGYVLVGVQGGLGDDFVVYDQEEDLGVILIDGFVEQVEFVFEVWVIFDVVCVCMEVKFRKF